jgi:5'-3' exonuclease
MGVIRLFRWIVKKFRKDIIVRIQKQGKKYIHLDKKIDYHRPQVLLIDCNAIFHPACREVYEPERPSVLNHQNETDEQKKLRAFQNVCKRLEELIRVANPSKSVYLAIDGVAGCCKQAQQRKRRFKTAKDVEMHPGSWDSSVLTVGTTFMKELGIFIINHFRQFPPMASYRDNTQAKLRVILNDMNNPGEGEHKLIRFMEHDRKYHSYCVYSPDADLIMLTMIIPKSDVTILRENIYDDQIGDYFLVNVAKLKQLFGEEIEKIHLTIDIASDRQMNLLDLNLNYMIKDVVLFLFMIGNDFLPSIPSLDILNNGIETLLQCYSKTVIKYGYLRHPFGPQKDQLNKESITFLFEQLSGLEPSLLYRKYKELHPIVPDTVMQQSVVQREGREELDMKHYRIQYYKRNFGNSDEIFIQSVCNEYIKGVSFVMEYYSKCIPTFDWYYPYHYAPLFEDLYHFVLNSKEMSYSFVMKPPLTQVEALASVLHPRNFGQLPKPVSDFLTLRSKLDLNFPTEFEVDLEGKIQEYEGVILLPMIEYDHIKHLLKSFSYPDPIGKILEL